MAKIPFTLEAWLKDKSQKVETRDGRTVEILSTNCKVRESQPILAQIRGSKNSYTLEYYYKGGTAEDQNYNLFLITPEPRFSEFEQVVNDLCWKVGMGEVVYEDDIIKKMAAELLNFARKEFIKQGYVIEKKAFHDAVEKIDDKHQVEMSVEYALYESITTRRAVMNWEEFQKVAQHFIDCGKAEALKKFEEKYKQSWFNEGKIAGRYEGLSEDEKYQQGVHDGKEEALKDLPRWKVSRAMRSTMPTVVWSDNGMILYKDGFEISISDLEKLPKEDEK